MNRSHFPSTADVENAAGCLLLGAAFLAGLLVGAVALWVLR